jgi:hypothetical protein
MLKMDAEIVRRFPWRSLTWPPAFCSLVLMLWLFIKYLMSQYPAFRALDIVVGAPMLAIIIFMWLPVFIVQLCGALVAIYLMLEHPSARTGKHISILLLAPAVTAVLFMVVTPRIL